MQIENPHLYDGHLARMKDSKQMNCERVWIVNGQIHKADANIRYNFNFSKLGETGIYIGTNPQSEIDIHKLSQDGITAVLNL